MNDFEKFAVSNGIGTNKLDGYNKYIVKNGIINPTILEERSLNVIGLDIFSRLQYDRILFLGTGIDEDVANIINPLVSLSNLWTINTLLPLYFFFSYLDTS